MECMWGRQVEGFLSLLANVSPCALSLSPEIRNQSTRAAFRIELPMCMCVMCVCKCVYQADVCHYSSRTAPPWLLAICFQALHFKWISGVCCFTTYTDFTAARRPVHIDRHPPPLSRYHLISALVSLNQQNGTYLCRALQFLAQDNIGLKQLLEETR